jgi:SET domain-containing protein
MRKKEFLKSLQEVYCRLGVTKHGVGVVAIRDIPKGTDPFKNCDPFGSVMRISETEFEEYNAPEEAKELVRDFCALQEGYYFVPTFGIDALDKSYFLNHSPKANMGTVDKGETFIAMRPIKKGEELCANYDHYQELHKDFRKNK